MSEAALLKKKPLPENFMKETSTLHQLDLVILGGAQCRIQTTDKMLADEIITELKAVGMWQRQVVKTWEYSQIDTPVKRAKKDDGA